MIESVASDKPRRIAIAIELDPPVPWHHDCYRGILQFAAQHGWSCVVDPYLVGMTGRSGIGDYDGVVGRITPQIAASANEQGIPVVNHWQNANAKGVPSVLPSYDEGGRLAGEHLVMNGYRHFAHVGINVDRINELELKGFTEVLNRHGLPAPACIEIDNDFEMSRDGVIAFRRALTDWLIGLPKPVGVMVQPCHAARYLAQISGELGLRVPHDVGIVVHHGDSVIVSSASPTLSAIDIDHFQIGYESAALLGRLMAGERVDPAGVRIAPQRVVVRESSDVFICSEPVVTEAMRYIADHCRQTLKVDQIAERLSTSRRTLERRFEEALGRSVYSEITRLRTDYIKRMLAETDLPMAAIAEHCGFSSPSHFTRFFRNEAGQTPTAFRRQLENDYLP
ncbi:MAG: helix-turn-helix domain-containing protein [Phycisphaeraceae bacterium]